MMYSAYLTLPCAVADPYRMSMCTVSPNCSGIVMEVVFLFDFGIVAVVPKSTMGSWSKVDMVKLLILVDFMSLMMFVTFLSPNLRRN